jgi:hypothetical protein
MISLQLFYCYSLPDYSNNNKEIITRFSYVYFQTVVGRAQKARRGWLPRERAKALGE